MLLNRFAKSVSKPTLTITLCIGQLIVFLATLKLLGFDMPMAHLPKIMMGAFVGGAIGLLLFTPVANKVISLSKKQ